MTDIEGFGEAADDFAEFADNLRAFAAGIDDAVDDGTRKTATQIERTAKRLAAVDTGTLRASIAYRQLDIGEYIIGTPVEYAADVEFGTQPHVIKADEADALAFEGQDGELIVRQSVQHPGVESRPYLRPALREHGPDLVENINKEITELLRTSLG